jgi:HAMP domain-containing protein
MKRRIEPQPQVMADLSKAVDMVRDAFRRRDELIEAYFKGFCPTLDKINQDQPEPSPEPDEVERLKQQVERLEQRNKEHEMFRHQHRDCDKMGIGLHRLKTAIEQMINIGREAMK